jgi:hypothetical protein
MDATDWVVIGATAALSSAGTLAGAYALFRWRWQRKMEGAFEERRRQVLEEMEHRLEEVGDRLRERLGETVEARVRSGVTAAIRDLPSSDLVKDTTRSVARTGAELLGEGLNALFGSRERRREPEEE